MLRAARIDDACKMSLVHAIKCVEEDLTKKEHTLHWLRVELSRL